MQHESQTRDNKSCSTSTHYRQRTSKARIDRSSPRDLQRRSTSREREKGEGGRRRRKMARGGRTTARARSHCLSRISHPSEFSGSEEKHEETIDREVDEREREAARGGGKRKNGRIYETGVVGKRRAACTTPLRRLACRSKLPICCVSCCPNQLPAVITCACLCAGRRCGLLVHAHSRALGQAVRGGEQTGSARTSRTERPAAGIYRAVDLTLRIPR